jgi:RNA:NAD 2'-phosphotransferase (TPT1/KptA family)
MSDVSIDSGVGATSVPDPLARRLRALALLGDEGEMVELSPRLPIEVQRTYLEPSGTRSIMRRWLSAKATRDRLSTTELLLGVHHLREHPSAAADALQSMGCPSFAQELADCSLEAGRSLSRRGRELYGELAIDLSVNYLLEAERELLFAISSGLVESHRAEALGKYAVCVAISSRWHRRPTRILARACEYHRESIRAGNTASEAYEYLVELLAERFNQSGDTSLLDEALSVAQAHHLVLAQAELTLKRGLLRRESSDSHAMRDFQEASELARQAAVSTGVEYVQRALVRELALSAMLGRRPLMAREIRLPNGFVLDLDRLSDAQAVILWEIVTSALEPMVQDLARRGKRPNLVAQDVLAAALENALHRSGYKDDTTAQALVAVSRLSSGQMFDRHLRWRHAEALRQRAVTSRGAEDVAEAVTFAGELASEHPRWPLTKMTLARSLQLQDEIDPGEVGRAPRTVSTAWHDFTDSILSAPEYRRSDLGGRSSVFAIEDARGDLTTAFVLKPVATREVGLRESRQLRLLAVALDARARDDEFGVPESLGVFPVDHDGGHVHLMERHVGRVLSSLPIDDALAYLRPCVELLAIYHRAAGSPAANSGWRSLKRGLKLWVPALLDEKATEEFVEAMRYSLPTDLPLVHKRDAHAGNWVIDSSDRVIAIDLDGATAVPLMHDVAQLIEDSAFLTPDRDGFEERMSLARHYRRELGIDISSPDLRRAYDWFALYRAVWLATAATTSKAQHAHARLLTHFIASTTETPGLRPAAELIADQLKASSAARPDRPPIGGTQRRLSKALSRILRHQAPNLGLDPDDGGFVPLESVARELRVDVDAVLEIATHPSEPRFQVLDGGIRALYGHSFEVEDLHELSVDLPEELYHGSSWDSLDSILADGLTPRTRRQVHLSNSMAEAMEVGRRHGHPVLLSARADGLVGLRAAAHAIWAADSVGKEGLRVRNAFAELAAVPGWLADPGTA